MSGKTVRQLRLSLPPGIFTLVIVMLASALLCGEIAGPCVGENLRVGTFKLSVLPSLGGPSLPVESVNLIQEGQILRYEPVDLPPSIRGKTKIALVLVPAPEATTEDLVVLDAKRAKSPADWDVPMRSSVVGVVFGPQGLDVKRISNLVNKDPQLVLQLATYAKQTATVNALISTLSDYEASRPGSQDLNAVLKGFSSRYGVFLPKLDSNASAQQQAQQLLQALVPTVSDYDPLASGRGMVMQQSAGVAASLAALFYGSPVGLMAGGAALFEGLRTMIFPNTDLRAAFVQSEASDGLKLCSQSHPLKARTRTAYLWMLRIPNAAVPAASLSDTQYIPMVVKSKANLTCATHEQLRMLPRAREWRLVSGEYETPVPVSVTVGETNDELSIDLRNVTVPAGDYHLAALWDWQPFAVKGTLKIVPLGNLADAYLTPQSEDLLIADSGWVKVDLTGADFEFVKSVALRTPSDPDAREDPAPRTVNFTLPKGFAAGKQATLEVKINTNRLMPGDYALMVTQANDKADLVPVTIHPPNPKIEGLPLRVNVGQPEQVVTLRGRGLDRIKTLRTPNAAWTLAPLPPDVTDATERKAMIRLLPGAKPGELLNASKSVEGINQPVEVEGIALVVGPRPRIESVDESFPKQGTVFLEKGEIPAGSPMSFALHVRNVDARPSLELACANTELGRKTLNLEPGDRTDIGPLDFAGDGVLFLLLDPGTVGQSGCELTATVTTPDAGASEPYKLGRLVRLPRIDKFLLTGEKISEAVYMGALTGQNLQMIEKTGWNSKTGYPVQGIPTPVPGNPNQQTLKIELPWPPPSPEAPIYVWLRGENQGRKTSATY